MNMIMYAVFTAMFLNYVGVHALGLLQSFVALGFLNGIRPLAAGFPLFYFT
jgi:hypothetical protein